MEEPPAVQLTEEERLAAEAKEKADEERRRKDKIHNEAKLEVANLSQRISEMEDGPEKQDLEDELEEAMCAVESDEEVAGR